MEAQWDIYRQQRKVLKDMRQHLFHLREEIQHKDQCPKLCDLASTPLSPKSSQNHQSVASDTSLSPAHRRLSWSSGSSSNTGESDHSHPFPSQSPQMPFVYKLPSYSQTHDNVSFAWRKPPEHWPQRCRKLFMTIRSSTVFRRLWVTSALCNNFTNWSYVHHDDFLSFYQEACLLDKFLPEKTPLRYPLTGGFEEFLVQVLRCDIAIGISALTTPPGMAYVPASPYCTPFGSTLLPLEDVFALHSNPQTKLLRPDGVHKQTLMKVLSLLDKNLKFRVPAGKPPFTVVLLYSRAHCRVMNEWVSQYEEKHRTHLCAI